MKDQITIKQKAPFSLIKFRFVHLREFAILYLFDNAHTRNSLMTDNTPVSAHLNNDAEAHPCRQCVSYEPGWCYSHDIPVQAGATCSEFVHWRMIPAEVTAPS